MSARRARLALVAVAVGLSGCATGDLSFRQDVRLSIVDPADRSDVAQPFEVRWTLRDPRPNELQFAMLVDQRPPRPGQSIESLLPDEVRDSTRCDAACRTAALAARGVTVTTDTASVVERLARRHGVSAERRRRHEVSVIVLDADLRRVGEAIAVVEVDAAP
ncbi:MAG: hypothetical protein HY828_02560 [Actinobacteria bacterium]|nr:hypothetical protein [Actinomycetota bacterium]